MQEEECREIKDKAYGAIQTINSSDELISFDMAFCLKAI